MNPDDGPICADDPLGVVIPGRTGRVTPLPGESPHQFGQRVANLSLRHIARASKRSERAARELGLEPGGNGGDDPDATIATVDELLAMLTRAAKRGDVAAAVRLLDAISKRGGGESIRAGREVPDEVLIASIESRARGRAG